MKKLLLSIGFFSLVSMTFGQGTKISLNPRTSTVEKKNKPGSSTKAVTGSLVCNTNYVAGTTMDLSFTLELTNTDDEFCDLFTLTFPAGITPNSSPSNPLVTPAIAPQATGTQLNPISGQTISWGTNDDANQYGGIAPGAPINFIVNVTIAPGTTGNLVANFVADGDTYIAAGNPSTASDLLGTAIIYPQGVTLPNIDVFAVRTFDNQTLDRKCSFTQDTIYAVLTNVGNTTESNVNINFEVNGLYIGQSPAFTLLGSFDIAPGDTAYAIMPFDFTGAGIKDMRAWSSVVGDVATSNDTIAEFFVNTVPTTLSNTNYTNGIETDFELNSLLSTWNGLGIGFGPSTGTVHTGTQALFYTVNTAIGATAGVYETYLVLPCLDVIQGETYKISYWRKSNSSTNPANINGSTAVFVGLGEDIASLSDTLKPYSAITPNAQAGAWQKDSVDYVADVCGTVYFAIGAKGTVATGTGINVRLDDILIEKTSTTSSFAQTACNSYLWNGQTYNQSGTYTSAFTNIDGCDSTVTLDLTINNSSSSNFSAISCLSYQWNNNTYTSTGVYNNTLINSLGCDSIVTLNLTIINGVSNTTTVTECDFFTWNGQTYNQSGIYSSVDTCAVQGVNDTLILTINNSFSNSISVTECSSYAWNGQTYSSSGSYIYNGQTSSGCDSIITLNLTINQPTTSSSTQSACGSYTWNGQTYNQSGTYTATLTNSTGCDSVATLNLIINTVTATATLGTSDNTISASAGSFYQWINCTGNTSISGATNQTFTPTANGSYAVIVTSNNCSDTSNCVTVSDVGIQETDLASIIVKPNPSTGIFQLLSDQFLNGDLVITDATGRVVSKEKLSQAMTIDISDVSQGIYYFNVITLDSNRVIRVIKN